MSIEQRAISEAFAVEQWPLHRPLRQSTCDRADRKRGNRRESEPGHQRIERQRTDDAHHVEQRRRQGGDEKVMKRVEHPHRCRGQRDERQERHHDPGKKDGEVQLPGNRDVLGCHEQANERFGQDDTEDHEDAGDEDEGVGYIAAKSKSRCLALCGEAGGEGRHEGGAHDAFSEQISQQVRNAKGDPIGVHLVGGAEIMCEDRFTNHSEHAARHRRGAARGGGACERRTGRRLRRQACVGRRR